MKTKYDKQQIMKRAWAIYRSSFVQISFSDALKESWKRAKQEAVLFDSLAKPVERKAYNYRLNRAYSGCRFGHNDWARDFQNDAREAIKKSFRQ